MSIKEISVWVGGVQMLIAAVVTRINEDVFDFHKATSYARAVSELAKTKLVSAAVIRFCYVVCLIELVVLVFIKFSKKGEISWA